jgi:glycosyltransferase involved in cell wall biosynthesis
VLRPDENAVLVPPSDPDALSAAILRVLQDETLARRIARRAFDDATAFTWAARAEKLERVLEAAVGL